jgi:hypothetical protein
MEREGSVRSSQDKSEKESVHSTHSNESETKKVAPKRSTSSVKVTDSESAEHVKQLSKEDIRKGISQLARTADGLSHAYVRFELRDTDTNDLKELSTYTHLRFIDVSRNAITSLKALQPLEHILALIATDNQLKDVDIGQSNVFAN